MARAGAALRVIVADWLRERLHAARDLKTGRAQALVGSNPTSSALTLATSEIRPSADFHGGRRSLIGPHPIRERKAVGKGAAAYAACHGKAAQKGSITDSRASRRQEDRGSLPKDRSETDPQLTCGRATQVESIANPGRSFLAIILSEDEYAWTLWL